MLSNFLIWQQIDSIPEVRDDNVESPPSQNDEEPFPVATLPGEGTSTMAELTRIPRAQLESRPRGRPQKQMKPRASMLHDHPRRSLRENSRKRGRPRGRPPRTPPVGQRTSVGLRKITSIDTDSSALSAAVTSDQEPPPGTTNTRYGLRCNRTPRYRCGTCGLRFCKCNLMIHANFPARSREVLLRREVKQSPANIMVRRLVLRTEKTYTGLQRSVAAHPLEYIFARMTSSTIAKAPCPRFKEWTHDLRGLEFTIPITIPPLPPNIAFGPFNYEREPIQLVRCITADLLNDKYDVVATRGDVYQPTTNWWLLITAQRVSDLVSPQVVHTCLESLRTMISPNYITCFHIIDQYCGKIKFEWWLELIITVLSNFPRIRFSDKWTHTFHEPVSIHSALHTLDAWSRANIDNQSLPRSVWQDLGAIKGHQRNLCDKRLTEDPRREIIYTGALKSQL